MLVTAGFYILSLYGVLSRHTLLFSALITIGFVYLSLKEIFPLRYLVTWILIFYIGILNTSYRLKQTDDLLNLAPINSEITGSIISIPQGKAEGKPKFFFKTDKIKFNSVEKQFGSEKVLAAINLTSETINKINDLEPYKSYRLIGRLSTPFKAGNPSQFDYGNYLRNHDAYAVFYAKDFEKLSVKQTCKEKFMQWVNNYRENVIKIHSQYLPSPNLEILGGIVFGDDAVSPPANVKQSFINSGLLHILAASGMNVAFIYGFFYFIMSIFKIPFRIKVVT